MGCCLVLNGCFILSDFRSMGLSFDLMDFESRL